LPIWGTQTTSESRLIVPGFEFCHNNNNSCSDDHTTTTTIDQEMDSLVESFQNLYIDECSWTPMKLYDNARYESQMFYFNTRTRVTYFPHNVQSHDICHCYDCSAEIYILKQYLIRDKQLLFSDYDTLNRKVSELSKKISQFCTPHGRRDLNTPQPKPFSIA
jgi:hypothetical protein